MDATHGYGEFVTDPTAQRTRLDEPKVMRIRRRSAAHQAWLSGDEFPVLLIAQANRSCPKRALHLYERLYPTLSKFFDER